VSSRHRQELPLVSTLVSQAARAIVLYVAASVTLSRTDVTYVLAEKMHVAPIQFVICGSSGIGVGYLALSRLATIFEG
jgi:hypothetical protein